MKSSLNFEQWIDHGNVGKIHLHIESMDQVKEVLNHLKIKYTDAYNEISIGDIISYNRIKTRIFRENTTKRVEAFECHIRIRRYEAKIILDVYKKKYVSLAETISVEVVNYVGNDCHINLKL